MLPLRLRTQGIAFVRFNHCIYVQIDSFTARVSTPVAAVATVATASPIGTQGVLFTFILHLVTYNVLLDFSSDTLPPLTPSPSDAGGPGWGTGDTQWFEDEARGVDADTDPREMDDDDDPRDASTPSLLLPPRNFTLLSDIFLAYVPTQESAQNSSPPQMMHTLRSGTSFILFDCFSLIT
jgi:hypothetical protein